MAPRPLSGRGGPKGGAGRGGAKGGAGGGRPRPGQGQRSGGKRPRDGGSAPGGPRAMRARAPSERRGRREAGADDQRERRGRREAAADAVRAALRPGPGRELIHGRRPVLEALRAGRGIDRIFVAAGAGERGALADLVNLAKTRRVPVQTVARQAIDAEADAAVHQGVVAVVAPLASVALDQLLAAPLADPSGEAPFLLALDSVTDPHNLGALVRSADAAGAHGVVVPQHRSAPLSATAVKSSAGALEHVPVAEVVNLARALDKLRASGVWCIGLDEDAETSLFDVDLADEPVCVVVGGEGAGLHRVVRQACDVIASIPMAGRVESLNAAVAGAIALFEIRRRRGPVKRGAPPPPGDLP
jgi:23S rRNA (guanosine2251-2'-O)-methyltransferase